MNKEEKEFFYSIGRGSLNLNGKFYYGLDYPVTDFMNSLEQENKQLKEVIEEVREYVEKTPIGSILEVHCGYEEEYTKPLLQILDKAKEN